MTANKIRAKELYICKKCGNVMVSRKVANNNSEKKKFETILQCIVCRYWVPLE